MSQESEQRLRRMVEYPLYDITERAQTGHTLADLNQLLEAVMESTPNLVACLDTQFNLLWVNRAYAATAGGEPSSCLGKNHFDLYPNAENEAIFRQVVQTGIPHVAQAKLFEYAERPDRSISHWDWSLVPVKDEKGIVTRLVLALTNAADRERMMATIREREAMFRALVESQGEGTSIVDLQERFVFANPAAESIFGVPPGALVGRCLREFVDQGYYETILAQTEKRKQEQKSTYELEIIRPDGERRSLFVTATPRYDGNSQFVGTFGVFRDITAEVRARDALTKARQELEQRVEERTAQLLRANDQLEKEIEERRRAEGMLRQRNHELALLHRSTQAFNSVLDLDQVLMLVLEEVRHLLGVAASSVWLVDSKSGDLVCRQSAGRQGRTVQGWRLAPGEGLAGWVIQSGESLIVPDARLDKRHFREIDLLTQLELPSILNVPLWARDKMIGVLQVLDVKPNRFSEADLAAVEPLAVSAANAIQNARLYEEAESLRAFNQNIVQSMDEGILLGDEAGNIIFANPSIARLLGYTSDQLLGQHWSILVPPEFEFEADRESDRLSQGAPARFEGVVLTKDGRRVPVLIGTRPLLHEGEYRGLLAVFTDITERRQAEELLRRQNQELLALNAIASVISENPGLGHVLNAALAKVIEVTQMDGGWIQFVEEGSTQGLLSLVAHQGLKEELVRDLETSGWGSGLMGRLIRSREPVVLKGGGQEMDSKLGRTWQTSWMLVVVPILARDSVLGALSVISYSPREVGPREVRLLSTIAQQIGLAAENLRLLQEASEIQVLRELNRLRSELIANVSHELRTPLGLIKVFTTTLLREDVSFERETQREFLHDIDEETTKLEELVRNLLDVSRMEEGRLHLERQLTDLGQLAHEVVEEMRIQPARQEIVLVFPSEPLTAWVDPRRVKQVLRNLLSNAVKYSPEGKVTTVYGCREERHVLIQVHDQGFGIPEKDLERIFERFYRVEATHAQGVSGVGLGLPVCRGIVEAHGGKIWAESSLGKGSVLSFVLPVGNVQEARLGFGTEEEQTS